MFHLSPLYNHLWSVVAGLGGVILMVLAFIIMKDDSNVFVLSYKLAGCILGPVAALFSFAMFFPRINTLVSIIYVFPSVFTLPLFIASNDYII